jgi:Spy/CpxP family protein refolding chaperone
MKKIIVSTFILAVATLGLQAQKTPQEKHGKFSGRHHQEAFQQLNLSEDQKAKFKSANEDFGKQMKALKANENITVKESKSKMESLRKDHRAKVQSLLTPEQKTQLAKAREERGSRHKADQEARMEKMKTRLGLSDDQAAKLKSNRAEMSGKMKALRENKSLSEEQKKEQMKELMKKQKESMKSVLTEEQLQKMNEGHKTRRPAKKAE